MTTPPYAVRPNRKANTVLSAASIVIGTYISAVSLSLAAYYFFNLGIPIGSPRYHGEAAFGMGMFSTLMVASSNISKDFKQTWIFPYCLLAAVLFSCISIPLHYLQPEFIHWYSGPLLTGLWGGVALAIFFHVQSRKTRKEINANDLVPGQGKAVTQLPNNPMDGRTGKDLKAIGSDSRLGNHAP
ncbi:MAG: hypothetical protein ACK5OB_15195 [Pirellula sp.]